VEAAASAPGSGGSGTLEAFIVEESLLERADTLNPLDRPVDNLFFSDMNLLEVPRSVTVLSPEALRQLEVRTFDDLSRVGAGLTRPNFFGVPGAPFIRGSEATVFYNGVKRVYNRNDRPTSFGSLEAMDIVKGPAPAHFGAALAGGYANFIPKSPYFDAARGSARVTVGSYDYLNAQFDIGGPTLLPGGTPGAYRLSITGQKDDTFYNNLRNDFLSAYGSIKAEPARGIKVFGGFEAFEFDSNENAGWNRPTQDLIDNGNYIVGSPRADLTDAQQRTLLGTFSNNIDAFTGSGSILGQSALVVPDDVFFDVYAPGSPQEIAAADVPGGQQYTEAFFAAGGEVITTQLEPEEVLADPDDFADSFNALTFFDVVNERNPDMPLTAKTFAEFLSFNKRSSYGFAADGVNVALAQRLQAETTRHFLGKDIELLFGGELRYDYASFMTDFTTELFNGRDLSTGTIPDTTTIPVGSQVDWTAGLAAETTLARSGLFLSMRSELTERLSLILGGRIEYARYDIGVPNSFNGPTGPGDFNQHDIVYGNWMVSPVYKLTENVSLYASIQRGTTETPNDFGAFRLGDANFNDTDLYEAGIKSALFGGKLFASAAVYYWDKTNLGETPIGADADTFRGKGLEIELSVEPVERFTILANFTAQRVNARFSLPFRTFNLDDEQTALYANSLQFDLGDTLANNPDFIAPGFPEVAANLFAVYQMKNGLGFGIGPTYRDGFFLNYERTLRVPSVILWNANLFYKGERVDLMLRFENFTDERWFKGSDGAFASNTLVTPGEPANVRFSVTWKW